MIRDVERERHKHECGWHDTHSMYAFDKDNAIHMAFDNNII